MSAQQFSTASVKVIRPEFQLIEVTNQAGFTSQSGHFIALGTIYGRLYFAEGCEPVGGSIKGKVIYDSRRNSTTNGWHKRAAGKRYEIHFICPDAREYARLLKVCDAPNMVINRVRTAKLVRELVANHTNVVQFPKQQSTVKQEPVVSETLVAMPDHLAEVPSAVVRTPSPVVETPVVEVVESIPVVEVPKPESNYSKYSFMLRYKPHTLRTRICKRFGILTTGIDDAHIHVYTIEQVVKRNISVAAIKAIFK